jgi:hypothetical protein
MGQPYKCYNLVSITKTSSLAWLLNLGPNKENQPKRSTALMNLYHLFHRQKYYQWMVVLDWSCCRKCSVLIQNTKQHPVLFHANSVHTICVLFSLSFLCHFVEGVQADVMLNQWHGRIVWVSLGLIMWATFLRLFGCMAKLNGPLVTNSLFLKLFWVPSCSSGCCLSRRFLLAWRGKRC